MRCNITQLLDPVNSLCNWFFAMTIGDFAQIVAAIGTAVTVYFSWQAVKQAEELSIKPVMALSPECQVHDDKLYFSIRNLSKSGDKWARDVTVKIVDSSFTESKRGFMGPETDTDICIPGISKSDWEGKELELIFKSFNSRVHTQRYLFRDDTLTEGKTGGYVYIERIS